MRTLDLFKAPGIAETIDWTNALVALNAIEPRARQRARHARRAAQAPRRHRQDAGRRHRQAARRAAGDGARLRRGLARGAMLADNVVHFARILRHAGVPVGPDRVLAALEAIEAVGLGRRDDVHAALSAVMLDRHEQQALFDDAFAAFWRDPKLLERMMAEMLPKISGRGDRETKPRSHRLADALAPPPLPEAARRSDKPDDEVEFETSFTFSDRERLQSADFESMTAAEFELAQHLAEEVPLPFAPVRRRRHAASARGRIDLRATMLAMARQPETLVPRFSRPRTELPTIVVLLDISGSMDRYARLHAALRARPDAALPQGPHADLRHAPHQHHAVAAPSRSRSRARARERAGRGLEGRHADRVVPRRLQPPLGAAPARRQRRAAARHRRPRSRRAGRADARRAAAAPVRAARSSGSIRCCASTASSRAPAACARCCRTSTASCRSTTWRASPTSPSRCASGRRRAARDRRMRRWNSAANDSSRPASTRPGPRSTTPRR